METMDRNNGSDNKKKLWMILLVVCLVGVVVAGTAFGVQRHRQNEAQKQMEALADQTRSDPDGEGTQGASSPAPTAAATPEQEKDPMEQLREMGVPIPEKEVDFKDLTENTNEDIYAWIYIPDTKVDYPVLQHPSDNYYYLNYNLDGSKGYPGCIYTEDYNAKDFTDPNTVLYGHNMKNGSMFAGLHKFEDMAYFEEHPYIYIYTPDKLYVYEIFAAYEYSNEHLLLNYDLTDSGVFAGYLEKIKDIRSMNCNYKEGVDVTIENHILTLSTCIADKPNNRYLVQGVLLNED